MTANPVGRIPWRTGLGPRPDLLVPPADMPLRLGRRPLKRWRWIGCFGEDVLLCAAIAHVGPFPVSWWALWDRKARTLAEHTVRRIGPVSLDGSSVTVDDGLVRMDLKLEEVDGVETVSRHGEGYIWTRKQGGIRVTGTAALGDRRFTIDAPGFIDDSAGYHARRTSWLWSAGVGVNTDDQAVAWNLVTGLHDAEAASERSVWVDGVAHEVAPATFLPGLAGVVFAEGGRLDFTQETTRVHKDNLLLVATDYEQPFGTFTGSLPGAGTLREAAGVMERHDVRW